MKGPWITGWRNQKYLGNRLWTSVLVKVAISYQALLSQTQSYIIIFNINFVFCQAGLLKQFMISFCRMPWVACWFTLREIIKHRSVFHPVCLKKYNKVLTEAWKGKSTNENMKEIKEREISNTLHKGLSVVPKTDVEIYVSISIGEYIIRFTCFLHCAKKGCVVENIKSKVATWKIVIEKISLLKW